MNKFFKIFLVMMAVLLSAGIFTTGCSVSLEEGGSKGKTAPDFTLPDLNGETVHLNDFRGKPVLLNIFATWCGPCVDEMPLIQQVYETRAPDGLVVLVMNTGESADEVRQFMQENGYTFPVVLDGDQSVTQKYSVRGIPTTFFIDSDGVIVETRVGAFADIEQIEASLAGIMSR
jgi:peroxiredoxin